MSIPFDAADALEADRTLLSPEASVAPELVAVEVVDVLAVEVIRCWPDEVWMMCTKPATTKLGGYKLELSNSRDGS